MAEQTQRAFLKQPKVFLSSKKSGKGKHPGKGGNRFWKNVGLGFKTHKEAIQGIYEKFASLFSSAVQDMRVGNGLEEGVIQLLSIHEDMALEEHPHRKSL